MLSLENAPSRTHKSPQRFVRQVVMLGVVVCCGGVIAAPQHEACLQADWSKAVAACRPLVDAGASDRAVYLRLAEAYFKTNRYLEAYVSAYEASALYPDNPRFSELETISNAMLTPEESQRVSQLPDKKEVLRATLASKAEQCLSEVDPLQKPSAACNDYLAMGGQSSLVKRRLEQRPVPSTTPSPAEPLAGTTPAQNTLQTALEARASYQRMEPQYRAAEAAMVDTLTSIFD